MTSLGEAWEGFMIRFQTLGALGLARSDGPEFRAVLSQPKLCDHTLSPGTGSQRSAPCSATMLVR